MTQKLSHENKPNYGANREKFSTRLTNAVQLVQPQNFKIGGTMQVKVKNWEKYNSRKDIKNPRWFAFSNRFFEDPDLFKLSNQEMLSFVYILCQASQRNKNDVCIEFEHAKRVANLEESDIVSAVKKLVQKGILTASAYKSVRKRTETSRDTTEQNRTGQDTTEQDKTRIPFAKRNLVSKPKPDQELNRKIREAYSNAYSARYKTTPVFNASVNGKISQLAKRLGTEAVHVVDFFVRHNDGFYVKSCHSIGLCLRDAEALHTQWKRGFSITGTKVREFEKRTTYEETLERIDREGF